ncbi:SWIM zinc finger family protein [Paenactinomyces guangxiensis]|uniref:SWIM zinc finger family protein n=1 Tax=Paenactinomyces guangxiensis TaxID=1490290 RepID=A0A7W1WU40_9BACL|nr:SWIM zinc finger family protein [Paenactinomyces guangxiensis]MBA4496089.1 SWIM zinc finger family protein [Paenactinomyces guangxiensis]MBH8593177.1 SWIM zinc finger family protein [Paenactinomyces guangxiensis]
MLFQQTYSKPSQISHASGKTVVSFSPDLGRDPTYFQGKIADPIRYRDAMCALRDVVVSDLTYKPKDHSAYQAWVEEQYILDIADQVAQYKELSERLKTVHSRLRELQMLRDRRNGDFNKAKRRYFDYLYTYDRAGWFVLDPVITVAPDQVFFEAFSQDESSYGRLAVREDVFSDVKEFQYGTTNIDFSDALYGELLRMRTYRPTEFQIDPAGFEVATEGREVYKEQKIDVPDSWIRGFLQVQSAMSLPTVSFDVKPIDIYNLCTFLRRHRERHSPRSLRYVLTPGEPVKLIIEPWNEKLIFSESVYTGDATREIRTWGRRRLFLLERLLPLSRRITIHLLGTGMPSFYIADLGSFSFTLGLSGWTRNDWAQAGNFDLMIGGGKADPRQSALVFAQLKLHKTLSSSELAARTQLSPDTVQAALRQLCSAGRVMYDLEEGKYRLRELTRDPLPMEQLQYANPREEEAAKLLSKEKITLQSIVENADEYELKGEVRSYKPVVRVDKDGRIKDASCSCYFYKQNRLMQGPCAHMLSLILTHRK